jgi:Rps23 Pro-64 3,4-dihydroxylase Tpa1-like proline 4-hydroxylase
MTADRDPILRPYDRDALKAEFDAARPFRHLVIEGFLEPAFAAEAAASFPTFDEAHPMGFGFDFVNERRKIQICDAEKFPEPVRRLHEALASPAFLADLEHITGIPRLLADEELAGGGMHLTGPHGRLDVHVDFNFEPQRALHRRLNILVYLNADWDERWGGEVELWDAKVRHCHRSVAPLLNRCVLFETSEISFHGVQPLRCPSDRARQSFAAYYYTQQPPAGWDGKAHSTVFRARPDERFRRWVAMPAEKAWREGRLFLRRVKRRLLGRA